MTDIRSSTPSEPDPEDAALPAATSPEGATGHYGPGYADPTRHLGNALPEQPASGSDAAEAQPLPAAPSTATDEAASAARPDLSSDEVGFRPPDRLPSDHAPESENAALIFERS